MCGMQRGQMVRHQSGIAVGNSNRAVTSNPSGSAGVATIDQELGAEGMAEQVWRNTWDTIPFAMALNTMNV